MGAREGARRAYWRTLLGPLSAISRCSTLGVGGRKIRRRIGDVHDASASLFGQDQSVVCVRPFIEVSREAHADLRL
jgi:hypothetical protein